MPARYKITINHGENATVYSVVDTEAPECNQPEVIASFSTAIHASRAQQLARFAADTHNERNRKNLKEVQS